MSVLNKLLTAGISACGGGYIMYALKKYDSDSFKVNASWTTNHDPSVKWDFNWDRLVKRYLFGLIGMKPPSPRSQQKARVRDFPRCEEKVINVNRLKAF